MWSMRINKLLARVFGVKQRQENENFILETVSWRGDTFIVKFERLKPITLNPEQIQLEDIDER